MALSLALALALTDEKVESGEQRLSLSLDSPQFGDARLVRFHLVTVLLCLLLSVLLLPSQHLLCLAHARLAGWGEVRGGEE